MHAHQRQPEMPTLQVLPVAQLLLHEQHDTQRSGTESTSSRN